MQNSIEQARRKYVTACRILANEGLADAAFSVSCRIGSDRLLINPVTSPTLVTPENILLISIDEQPVMGKVHPEIYKVRKDVNAIVHAHPPHAIAFSTLEEEFVPVHHYGSIFHEQISVYKSQGQVKTKERGNEIAQLVGNGRAILQRGHGTLVMGKNIEEAVLGTIYLEEACKINFLAHKMGAPHYLSKEQSRHIAGQVFKERSILKAWDHYVSKLK